MTKIWPSRHYKCPIKHRYKQRKYNAEVVDWWVPERENTELHEYAHKMFNRRGYSMVDKITNFNQYTCQGNKFSWFEWIEPQIVTSKWGCSFQDLWGDALEENAWHDAFSEVVADTSETITTGQSQ